MTNTQIFIAALFAVAAAAYFWIARKKEALPTKPSPAKEGEKAEPRHDDSAEKAAAKERADAKARAEAKALASADEQAREKAVLVAAGEAKVRVEPLKTPLAESFAPPEVNQNPPPPSSSSPASRQLAPLRASVPSAKMVAPKAPSIKVPSVPSASRVEPSTAPPPGSSEASRPVASESFAEPGKPPPSASLRPAATQSDAPTRIGIPLPISTPVVAPARAAAQVPVPASGPTAAPAPFAPPAPSLKQAVPVAAPPPAIKSEPRLPPAVAFVPATVAVDAPGSHAAESAKASEPTTSDSFNKVDEKAAAVAVPTKDEFDLTLADLDSRPKLDAKPSVVPVPLVAKPAIASETAELEKNDPDHAKARRFSRVAVSEIKLYHEQEVVEGRVAKDLWRRLNQDIMMSVQTYEKRVPQAVRDRFDYLYDELIRQLAEGKPELLGPDAPGATAKARPLRK